MKLTLLVIALCLVNTLASPTVPQEIQPLVSLSQNSRASVIGNFLQAIDQGISNFEKVKEIFQMVIGTMINKRGKIYLILFD